jgi:hypothetical protein
LTARTYNRRRPLSIWSVRRLKAGDVLIARGGLLGVAIFRGFFDGRNKRSTAKAASGGIVRVAMGVPADGNGLHADHFPDRSMDDPMLYEHAVAHHKDWLVEAMVQAGIQFAAEHPDAPRANVLVEA